MYAANDVVGPQNQRIRDAVAHEYSGQKHVTQFSTGRSDYRRVVVADENAAHEHGDQNAGGAEGHRADRPAAVRPQVLFRDAVAAHVQRIRDGSLRTGYALRRVRRMPNLEHKRDRHFFLMFRKRAHDERTRFKAVSQKNPRSLRSAFLASFRAHGAAGLLLHANEKRQSGCSVSSYSPLPDHMPIR